jgi:hypothetical protein
MAGSVIIFTFFWVCVWGEGVIAALHCYCLVYTVYCAALPCDICYTAHVGDCHCGWSINDGMGSEAIGAPFRPAALCGHVRADGLRVRIGAAWR